MERLKIQRFPGDMSGFPNPNKDFDRCLLCGLFKESSSVNGTERNFYTYIAEGLPYDSRCLVIAPPDDEEPAEFLVSSGRRTSPTVSACFCTRSFHSGGGVLTAATLRR